MPPAVHMAEATNSWSATEVQRFLIPLFSWSASTFHRHQRRNNKQIELSTTERIKLLLYNALCDVYVIPLSSVVLWGSSRGSVRLYPDISYLFIPMVIVIAQVTFQQLLLIPFTMREIFLKPLIIIITFCPSTYH